MSNLAKVENEFNVLASNSDIAEELFGLDEGFEKITFQDGKFNSNNETTEEFDGVILHQQPQLVYYKNPFDGSKNPPDCMSADGVCGNGEPGGECSKCPLNKFGSGVNGGKACKNRRLLYILRKGEMFPVIFSVPTASMKSFSLYIKSLLSTGKKSNTVVTKFTTQKAQNKKGMNYTQVVFTKLRDLEESELKNILPLSEQAKAFAQNQITVVTDDV